MLKKTLFTIFPLFCIVSASAYADTNNIIASWVQYTEAGIEARAVVQGECPDIMVDGAQIAMTLRAKPDIDHNDTVCTSLLNPGVQQIELKGQALPVPVKDPKTILVIGDTGCRVSSSHGLYQACNNSSDWPFKRLAKSAASFSPDLILYTGDYIYREAPCPDGNDGCKGTPYGDKLATWQADWFLPARPLHQAAPMILTRGNHETCSRAGTGWFRYLDARDYDGECTLNHFPWVADLGSQDIAVLDTANLKDAQDNPLTPRFERELLLLKTTLAKESWILTHRPFWGYGADDDTGELEVQTDVLQDAVRIAGLPEKNTLLISAHIHLAQIIRFKESKRPTQLVIGNGGTQLVPDVAEIGEIDGETIETQRVLNQFGYAMMDKIKSHQWRITFYDQAGHPLETCHLSNKSLSCK